MSTSTRNTLCSTFWSIKICQEILCHLW